LRSQRARLYALHIHRFEERSVDRETRDLAREIVGGDRKGSGRVSVHEALIINAKVTVRSGRMAQRPIAEQTRKRSSENQGDRHPSRTLHSPLSPLERDVFSQLERTFAVAHPTSAQTSTRTGVQRLRSLCVPTARRAVDLR
jgi:hypothetical protein